MLVAGAMVMGSLVATSTAAQATIYQREMPKGSYLLPGDELRYVVSTITVRLRIENGTLYLRKSTAGVQKLCWLQIYASHAVYQRDGNFVTINSAGNVSWASNTVGQSGNARVDANGFYVGSRKIASC
ncbi:hypothetical protein GCM10009687_59510 [Asanoa iriomotensis]|uniref:Bulb-type lectin domain-containing protein n=2 Tax=Asanoa iriomotensis TaxID=234613 RepID=A0ABQ4BVS5_9ACTN|nr:hypothetical protein Air01nite_02400 [Asanoa iriomotensis]